MIPLVLLVSNLLFPLAAAAILAGFALSARRRLLLDLGAELGERLGGLSARSLELLAGRRVLWVHAASAGEVGAVAPLLDRIKRQPAPPAVILPSADVAVLSPADSWWTVRRFLRAVRPAGLLVVETELWPNMLALAASSGARIALVNGRLTERSFRRYRLLRPLVRAFLGCFERLGVQTEADARRFIALGAEPARVAVLGNMKYDVLSPSGPAPEIEGLLARLGWKARPLIVAGSTHPGEEELVLEAFAETLKAHPDARLVMAPRHSERAGQTAQLLERRGIAHALWSRGPAAAPGGAEPAVLVVDVHGVLAACYPLARAAFVGGSLVPVGGHNLLEPALAGVPVLFGPHTFSTPDTAALLEERHGGLRVSGAADLGAFLKELLDDPGRARAMGAKARTAAQSLQGAVERTWRECASIVEGR